MSTFMKRQFRTMCILIVIVVVITSTAIYIRLIPDNEQVTALQTEMAISQDVAYAMARYERNTGSKAVLNGASVTQNDQKAMLIFTGMTDAITMQALVDLLAQNNTEAMFFFTAKEAENNPNSLRVLTDAKCTIGVSGMETAFDWESGDDQTLIENLCQSNAIFLQATSLQPSVLLASSETISDGMLAGANACYYQQVITTTTTLGTQDFVLQEDATLYVEELARGSRIGLTLASGENRILTMLSWLLPALTETDLSVQAEALIVQNEAKQAECTNMVYTTQSSLSYTFSNLGNAQELSYVLTTLSDLGAQATFFVTPTEMLENSALIQWIVADGHEIGVHLVLDGSEDTQSMTETLLLGRELLDNLYGQAEGSIAYLSNTEVSDALLEAVSATNFTLINPSIEAVQLADIRQTDVQAIYDTYHAEHEEALQRGSIIHFTMNQYLLDDTLLGQFVQTITERKNGYSVVSITSLIDSVWAYDYPAEDRHVQMQSGQLGENEFSTKLSTYYVGSKAYSTTETLLSFESAQMQRMDKTGVIKNNENWVFLTFDGWTDDAQMTDILNVLRSHHAKATFFVTGEDALSNPNLLRSIAIEGHTIAVATNSEDVTNQVVSLGETSASMTGFEMDIITSYSAISGIMGDVIVDGQRALSTLIRPTTQTITKTAMEMMYDCGYRYVVLGNELWFEEIVTSADSVVEAMVAQWSAGTVARMQVDDAFIVEALESYLTRIESEMGDKAYQYVDLLTALPDGI